MTRTAVITGMSSGLGKATGDRLRRDGWDVVGIDLTPAEGCIETDVSNDESVAAAAASLEGRKIDALVCAAGIWSPKDDRYATVDLDVWRRTWEVNVTGTMLCVRHFAPLLNPGSGIVTFASIAALTGMPRRDSYTASKGAIVALTRAWATDLVRLGIRVNCVAPGVVETPMTDVQSGAAGLDLPLGRMATAEEIADVVVSTLGEHATYLNGAILPIDGGLTASSRLAVITPRG
jgi:NAD(P)-dependent dehydrogenase (short-subunit alcohol dehydrogenase family)